MLLRKRQVYLLRLYLTDISPATVRSINSLRALCEGRLEGRFELEVIDISQKRALAHGEQIVAPSTLLRLLPAAMQMAIGDVAGAGGRLFGLDLQPRLRRPR